MAYISSEYDILCENATLNFDQNFFYLFYADVNSLEKTHN